jgi:Mg-chelatase subunit ChlD
LSASWSLTSIFSPRLSSRSRDSEGDAHSLVVSPLQRIILGCVLAPLLGGACTAAAQSPTEAPFDVVLTLDNSGSMKNNDPSRLMPTAVMALADRLPTDSRLSVVAFDSTARLAIPLANVADSGFRAALGRALDGLDYRGKWTDIPGAIERALYELREHGRPGARRVLILFTDGVVDLGDPQRNRSRANWLTSELVPEAKQDNVMIFGIAFTDQADFELIQTISRNTEGTHFRIYSAPDISGVFRQVTDRIRQLRVQATPASGPVSPGTPTTPAGIGAGVVRWAGVCLAGLLVFGLVWIWRERALAPPVPATLDDCRRGTTYTVSKRVFRVGKVPYHRLRRNDLVIPEATVSRGHAKIQYRNGAFYVRDDGSRNHTYVTTKNETGEPVTRRVEDRTFEKLENGDILRFDAYEFQLGAAPERVQRAVARGGTQGAPDEYHEYGSGTVPPEPKAPAKAPEGRPLRKETIPPSGLTETCLKCDGTFGVDHVTTWRDFRLCSTCESDIQALSTEQAESLRRELDKKKRRRADTVGMK